MAANTSPIYTLVPNCIPIHLAAANLASDGSGTLVNLVVAGADGTRVDTVTFRNAQTTQAASSNMLGKLFLSDAAGANFRLVEEAQILAATRSSTVKGANSTVTFYPALPMKSGQILAVCQSIYASAADQNSVIAIAGNF